MSKSAKYILTGLATLLIAAFVVLTLSLDYLVTSGIETTGTEMTGTTVTVESVSLSPFSGQGTIERLRVQNPEGFDSEYAIVIQNFEIAVDVRSLLSDTVIVEEIRIAGPSISVIQKVPENNLRMLLKNMESDAASESDSSMPALVIRKLVVSEGSVTVTPNIGAQPSATVSMNRIEMQNLGTDSDSAKEVIRQVASRVIGEALQSALSGQLDELKNKAKDAMKDIFN